MLTAEALAAVQAVAQGIIPDEMKTEITIFHRTPPANPDSNPYGSSAETWVESETILGWLEELSAKKLTEQGDLVVDIQTFELRLPVGTAIDPGDRVRAGGREFTVQDTNAGETLQVFTEASLLIAE